MRANQRRMSADHGIDLINPKLALTSELAVVASGIVFFNSTLLPDGTLIELAGSYIDVIARSGDDVKAEVEIWFNTRFPPPPSLLLYNRVRGQRMSALMSVKSFTRIFAVTINIDGKVNAAT